MAKGIHVDDLKERSRKVLIQFRGPEMLQLQIDHYAIECRVLPSEAARRLLILGIEAANIPKQASHLTPIIRSAPAARSAAKQQEIIDQRARDKFGPTLHPTYCAHCGATEFFDWITAEVPHFGLCNMTPIGGCGKRSDMADYYKEGE